MNEVSLWHKLNIVQWVLTVGALAVVVFWQFTDPTLSRQLVWCCISAAALTALSLSETANDNEQWRCGILLSEVTVLFVMSIFGSPFFFTLFFIVIAAKASTMLSGKILIVCFTALLLAVAGSTELKSALKLPAPKHEMPAIVRSVTRIEFELSILVTICAVGFLARTMISEQRARAVAERLTREIEEMTMTLERTRIAQDMHDNLGHILTSLSIQLELTMELQQQQKLEQSEQALASAMQLATDSFDELRRAIRAIREDFDLAEAITKVTQRIAEQQKIKVELDVDSIQLPLSSRYELFSVVQECLTNIQKHSRATDAKVQLKVMDGMIELTVHDNGVGYQTDSASSGFGIIGMRDRAKRLGGSLTIEPGETHGTVVRVMVPS